MGRTPFQSLFRYRRTPPSRARLRRVDCVGTFQFLSLGIGESDTFIVGMSDRVTLRQAQGERFFPARGELVEP